jgi:HSP20 family protein
MMWRKLHRRPVLAGRMIRHDLQGLHSRTEFRLGGTHGPVRSGYPLINAWVNDDGIVLTAEIPGVELDNLDISIVDLSLTLSGTRNAPEFPEDAHIRGRERNHGEFNRTLELPFRVNIAEVDAQLKNGVLRLELPRLPEEKPRKIEIKTS